MILVGVDDKWRSSP